MRDSLSQLLKDADQSAPPLPPRVMGAIIDAVRRRRRREQVRNRVAAGACVVIALLAVGFTLRPRDPAIEIVQRPPEKTSPPTRKTSSAQLDVDARLAELTARHLLAGETRRRVVASAVDVQEQRDRAALVLLYEGDGYARGKRSTDAIAAYQRAIELFPQSRWADVARQRLKEFAT